MNHPWNTRFFRSLSRCSRWGMGFAMTFHLYPPLFYAVFLKVATCSNIMRQHITKSMGTGNVVSYLPFWTSEWHFRGNETEWYPRSSLACLHIFKGCRPCRRPRKNRQGSQANWHKNSSVLRTLRLSTFFLCILLWNIFDRFEFSFVNGFFMIYWLSWSRRSLCMSIQVRAMWSGGGSCLGSCFRFGVNLQ